MRYPESMKAEALELHSRGLSVRAICAELVLPSRMAAWRWICGAHDDPGTCPAKRRDAAQLRSPM